MKAGNGPLVIFLKELQYLRKFNMFQLFDYEKTGLGNFVYPTLKKDKQEIK